MAWLTPTELRSTLNISKSTEHRLLKDGLPCLGAGRLRRYDQEAAVEWFGAHTRQRNLAGILLRRMHACDADTPGEM